MGGTPDNPESRSSWRGRPVNTGHSPTDPLQAPPNAPPTNPLPGGNSGGSGPKWGAILAVIFGLIAGLMFLWILGLSAELEEEESTRINAEREAATAATQRNEAIETANAAIGRANQEVALRATAEADAGAAEQLAQRETRLRATAEAQERRAESARNLAETDLERESSLRATAEVELRETTQQSEFDLTVSEVALALTLAETSPTLLAIATQEVNFYIDPIPWYASGDVTDAVQDIVEVLEEWTPYGARIRRTLDEVEADIHVQWVRDYGDHILGLAVNQSVIHVGLGSTNCNDEWQAFDANTVKKVLWHEFGHAFGYGHSIKPDNIMYPTLETRFTVEKDIADVVAAGWYHTYPFCDEGRYSFEFETDDASSDFEFAVLPPDVSIEDYLYDDGKPNYSCEYGDLQRVDDTCRVYPGDKVIIYNDDEDEAIRISGTIILLDQPDWPDMQWDEDAFSYDDETLDYYRELFAEE